MCLCLTKLTKTQIHKPSKEASRTRIRAAAPHTYNSSPLVASSGDANSVSAALLLTDIGHQETVRGLGALGGRVPQLGERVRVRIQSCQPHSGLLRLVVV